MVGEEEANLDVIRQEDCTRQAASKATGNINDANTQCAGQLLKISHHKELKHHGDQQLK